MAQYGLCHTQDQLWWTNHAKGFHTFAKDDKVFAERGGKYVEATVNSVGNGNYSLSYDSDGKSWKGDTGQFVYGSMDWVPKQYGGTGAYENSKSALVRSYQPGETGAGEMSSTGATSDAPAAATAATGPSDG